MKHIEVIDSEKEVFITPVCDRIGSQVVKEFSLIFKDGTYAIHWELGLAVNDNENFFYMVAFHDNWVFGSQSAKGIPKHYEFCRLQALNVGDKMVAVSLWRKASPKGKVQ